MYFDSAGTFPSAGELASSEQPHGQPGARLRTRTVHLANRLHGLAMDR